MTRGQFANRVTVGLGAKVTLHTRRAWQAQLQAEGGSAKNNPFNTTMPMPGATNFNSVGVKNYVSAEQGIKATIKTRSKRVGMATRKFSSYCAPTLVRYRSLPQ